MRAMLKALYNTSAKRWRVFVPLLPTAGVLLVAKSGQLAEHCPNMHNALAFGIRTARIAELTTGCAIDTGQLQRAMWFDNAGALLYAVGLAAVLLVYWRFGWRSRRQGSFDAALKVMCLPLAAGLFDIAENMTVLWSASVENDAVRIGHLPAQFAATFGLAKWLLLAVTAFAIFLTLYGAFRFRALKLVDWETVDEDKANRVTPSTAPAKGLAVCLSGGGIRSASFSWGALAQMHSNGLFNKVTSLYTVSGGGYAANAWTSSDPKLRTAFDDGFFAIDDKATSDDTAPPITPFQYVHRNNRYLDSLRGGIGLSLMKASIGIMVNVSVIVGGILIVAILPGLLARSVFGAVTNKVVNPDPPSWILRNGAWLPVLWTLALAGLAFAVSWVLRRTKRRVVLQVMGVFVGLAAAMATVTIALPLLAHNLYDIFDKARWAALPAAVTWVGGLVVAYFRPRLSKVAIRLGGVLSAIGMFYVFVWVIRRAVVPSARLWSWLPDAHSAKLHWLVVLGVAAAFLMLLDHTGVQWWSLHPLYRERLAGAFVMRQKDGGEIVRRPANEWPRWSQPDQLNPEAPGPKHVICAATHRHEPEVTGLKSLSYRFSTDGVAFCEPVLDEGNVANNCYSGSATWLDETFAIQPGEPGPARRFVRKVFKPHARSTAVAAAAMSGAAFNSVMGRQSKGTTDSLLAVLNLRLGVWMPNNRFETSRGLSWLFKERADKARRFPRPGLRYLFHEVIGHFDIEDPFVHVSDGGHWENLGLTEAVRDRAQRIIVVDASGGRVAPLTDGAVGEGFASLHEAIDLARIELATEIEIDVSAMRPDRQSGRAIRNWADGTITYHKDRVHHWGPECDKNCRKAKLLYIKAVISDRTPEGVLAYANTDRVFPDYPTGNQFLTDEQFGALVRLGSSAVKDALSKSETIAARVRPPAR